MLEVILFRHIQTNTAYSSDIVAVSYFLRIYIYLETGGMTLRHA